MSLREHLLRVYDQTGLIPPQLEPAECADEILYLWRYFVSMSQRRTSNGFSENPIGLLEMKAWSELHATPLSAFEVQVIDLIESAYLSRKK